MGPFDKGVKREVFDSFKAAVQQDLLGLREALSAANTSNAQVIAALRAELAAKTPESEAQVHEVAAKAHESPPTVMHWLN